MRLFLRLLRLVWLQNRVFDDPTQGSVIQPYGRPRYTLVGLLTVPDYGQLRTAEEREWIDAPASGRELL